MRRYSIVAFTCMVLFLLCCCTAINHESLTVTPEFPAVKAEESVFFPPFNVNIQTSRALDWWEKNRALLLTAKYLYEGLRPELELTPGMKEGELIYAELPEDDGRLQYTWILPEEQLTDEQILQIICKKYPQEDIETSYYIPPAEQLQYQDVKERVASLAVDFGLELDPPAEIYPYYIGYQPVGEGVWKSLLIYENSYHYQLDVASADGSFVFWKRYAPGYFTADSQPTARWFLGNAYSDEDVYALAEHYAEQFQSETEAAIIRIELVEIGESNWGVVLGLSGDGVYSYVVGENDGTLIIDSVRRGSTDFTSLSKA